MVIMESSELILCFQDTMNLVNSKTLLYETEKTYNSNKIYYENFTSEVKKIKEKGDIIVQNNTSFAAAKMFLKYGKTAVLNFANPENPGGGVQNGAMAQEECLCRSSNLFACLSAKNVYEDFYEYHRKLHNYFYSDRLIYTSGVTVIKTDDVIPQIMEQSNWFKVDIITCAAPYLAKRKYINKTALKELFKQRIKNIFEAAIDNEIEVLILGAFGCGAFKNPPRVVAKAFHEIIEENEYDKMFKKIVFAIKSTTNNDPFNACPNIMSFEQEFDGISMEANKLRFTDSYAFAQKIGTVAMPSGRVLEGEKEFNPYIEWKEKNKYLNKQFAILGDSISTLEGYHPNGYKSFYTGENCGRAGVFEMKDTWWGQVIGFFGGELLVNNSWSGSRVTKLPASNQLFPSGCSDERTHGLHINTTNPDVIIVYLGTNDWAFGAYTGGETRIVDDEDTLYFSWAYSKMLEKLKQIIQTQKYGAVL